MELSSTFIHEIGYTLWQYGLSSFQGGGVQNKIDFCLKINCSQMKLSNFENWCSGELSKNGHILVIKSFKKLMLSQNVNKKSVLLN